MWGTTNTNIEDWPYFCGDGQTLETTFKILELGERFTGKHQNRRERYIYMTKHSPENRPPGHETDLFLPEPESVLHDRKMTCGSDHWMHARWKLASTLL